jgi:hypothetical protein
VGGVRFVDEIGFAFGWIAPQPGFMQRASHAVASHGRVCGRAASGHSARKLPPSCAVT